jgi:hypothetical protein
VANGDDPTGRFKTIVDRLDAYDAATDSDGFGYVYSILQDVNNMIRFPLQGQWSVVFDLRTSRLYLSTANNGDLHYFDLKDFDFSCQTDVDVLDINGAGTGLGGRTARFRAGASSRTRKRRRRLACSSRSRLARTWASAESGRMARFSAGMTSL